jgi:tRNA(Ile)-lysidine synthase
LFRGTGLEGLGGIPAVRKDIPVVRPLLFATRSQIAAYAKARHLDYREDSSNASDKYSRNFVRHRIFSPVEKRLQPAVIEHIAETARIVESALETLAPLVNKAAQSVVSTHQGALSLNASKLKTLPDYAAHMIVHNALQEVGVEPTAKGIRAIIELTAAQRGMSVECGSGWTAARGDQDIVLTKRKKTLPFRLLLEEAGAVEIHNRRITAVRQRSIPKKLGGDGGVEYLDAERVRFPLIVRSWRRGDRFMPLGMNSEKKISDFFVDAKILRDEKHTIPVVVSGNDIVCVAGFRIDERYKITTTTRSVVRLTVQRIDMENIEGS